MQISVKPNTYIYLTFLLFTVPLRWIISWLIASAFHELCHIFAVKLCRGKVYSLTVGIGGADIQCSNLSDRLRIFAILSGPVGGLVFSLLGNWFPRVALCSFFLSIYNLIPIMPFDGGRAFSILLINKRMFFCFQRVFIIIAFIIALFVVLYFRLGPLPLLIVFVIWLKNRNTPCK